MNKPGWKRMCFKGNKVWVAMDADDIPEVTKGKVLIKYQLDQSHEYQVHPQSVRPLPQKGGCKLDSNTGATAAATRDSHRKTGRQADDEATIHIYTDGASSGNPGPAGIGVFLRYGVHEKEISQYIGIATNNIAELEAIRTGLSEIKNTRLPVRIYTDSSYAVGLLTQGWKPKKNHDLVTSITKLMKLFKDLRFIKVKGHSGNAGNEKADRLATGAIKSASAARK